MRCVLAAGLIATATAALAADALPRLNILPGSLTVSGVSSGGYMASQYQVSYSKDVIGAGIIAAGPWYCAQGLLTRALDDCMKGGAIGPEIGPLVTALRNSAKAGDIDDPSWIVPDRVWIFHGKRDTVVGAAVTDSLLRFYRAFVPPERIQYETQVEAAHGFPAAGRGCDCGVAQSPWINDCRYDAAGQLLKHLYDGLREPVGTVAGELRTFDQEPYATGGTLASFAESGFLFVPKDCAAGKPCHIHVAFHGCRQGIGFIGNRFARDAGYNPWADANRIVVLYPQVASSRVWPFNPKGCWDWWGYSGSGYATRSGAQLASVRRMLAALGAR
ncbi:MAG: polyhydroxybutyrate depolymerase [Betaproteobacteria bacterium]|nr:MAG: polyhydroxybutyrate depolymerase [Betaproteobacteria bacterium]